MKTILLFVLMVALTSLMYGQNEGKASKMFDVFIPQTLSAGTRMTGRTAATTYDDTTRGFSVRGWSKAYVGVETAGNDSGLTLLAYSTSHDGIAFDTPVLFDSLDASGQVGRDKYFELPAAAMGAVQVRIRAYGSTTASTGYSANPVQTVTLRVIRKP